jgi:hypothetical protein
VGEQLVIMKVRTLLAREVMLKKNLKVLLNFWREAEKKRVNDYFLIN